MGQLDNSKLGYSLSVAIHLSVVIGVFVSILVKNLLPQEPEEPPVVFQMLEPTPEAPPEPPSTSTPPPDIVQPQVKNIEPINLPDPTPPEPDPEPEPEQKKPDPAPDPTPTPAKKPKPKPVEKTKVTSFKDFQKQNPNKRPKTSTKPSTSTKPVIAPKITATTSNISNISNISDSASKNILSSAQKNALAAYYQYINKTAKATWIAPDSTLGMELSCGIKFDISVRGIISNVRITRSSGNKEFDNSVLVAFNAMSLMPPPDNSARTITIQFISD